MNTRWFLTDYTLIRLQAGKQFITRSVEIIK